MLTKEQIFLAANQAVVMITEAEDSLAEARDFLDKILEDQELFEAEDNTNLVEVT